jgi:Uma2 family endonuclease
MPAVITLDDLATMIAADTHGRRYETSPEGVLFVVPPPTSSHAVVASRLMGWLMNAGWPLEQVLQGLGVRIPGPEVDGGRVPDLTLWARPQPDTVWLPATELVLAVEIVSRGSEGIDQVLKVAEYARAGIPRYWTVARDEAQTVTLYRLTDQGIYETTTRVPLAKLLQASPEEYLEVKPSAAR